MDELDLTEFSDDDINSALESFSKGSEVSTDTEQEPQQEEPSTEGQGGVRSMNQVYRDRMAEGRDPRRPGVIGTAQDILEGTGRNLY